MTNSAAAAATSLAASSKQSKQKQIVPSTNHSPTKPTSRSLSVEPRGRNDNNSNRLSSDRSQRAPTSGRQQKSGAMSSKQSKQPAPNLSAEMWASVEDLFWVSLVFVSTVTKRKRADLRLATSAVLSSLRSGERVADADADRVGLARLSSES